MIDKLTASQKELEKAGLKSTQTYQQNAEQLRQLKSEVRDVNKYVDNVSKAINAENNSIQQNRALLSVLTSDYVKLDQSLGSADKKVQQAGQDIAKLTETLKNQEKQIGQTYRNVGNYTSALDGVAGKITELVPGGNQLSTIISSIGNSFNVMGEGAEGAAGGLETMGAASTAALGVIGLLAMALYGLYEYLKDVATVSDKLSGVWAGMKASGTAFFNDLGKGVSFGQLAKDMSDADKAARQYTQSMIDLNRAMMGSDAAKAQEDAQIATMMLKMRNIHTTADEADKIFAHIQDISEKQYLRVHQIAVTGYAATAKQLINLAGLQKSEYDKLIKGGVSYAEQLKASGAHISDDIIKQLQQYQIQMAQADGIYEQREQRAQNRDDAKRAKDDAAREKAQQDAQRAAEKEAKLQQDIAKATEDANNEKIASISRMLQLQMSAFAKELSTTDEHYRQLIIKRQDFINKYEHMTPKQQSRYAGAYQANQAAISQLEKEHYEARLKQITDFNKSMAEKVQQSNNELQNLKIANIQNERQREMAQLDEQEQEQQQALKKKYEDTNETISKYENDIKSIEDKIRKSKSASEKASYEQELTALKQQLGQQEDILGVYGDEDVQLTKKYSQARADVIKKYADKETQDILHAQTLKDSLGTKAFSGDTKLLADQKAETEKKYDVEIEAAKKAGLSTYSLEVEKQQALLKLVTDYSQKRADVELAIAKTVSNAAFSILNNSIKSSADAKQASLEDAKSKELANTSLTSGQKILIEDKYRKKELDAKVKAFKEEQKASIAQAIINGALAMTKVAAQTGVLSFAFDPIIAAETAAQIGVILAQKPPAYATGGVHYVSDGRGALLRGPGTGTSDSMNAKVSNGEAVINARSTSMFADVLSAINVAGGGKPFGSNTSGAFATGGVAGNTYLPTQNNPARM